MDYEHRRQAAGHNDIESSSQEIEVIPSPDATILPGTKLPWGARLILQYIPLFIKFPRCSYKTWTWVLTFMIYVDYHMTRKVFSAVKSELAPGCSSHDTCDIMNSSNSSILLELDRNTSDDACSVSTWTGWPPFNKENHCRTLLGGVDYAWLFAYAIFSFFSGMIADRMNLRYFLTISLISKTAQRNTVELNHKKTILNVLVKQFKFLAYTFYLSVLKWKSSLIYLLQKFYLMTIIYFLGCGIATCLVGLAEYARIQSIYYFVFIQLLNGALQSSGWPGVISVMGNWFGKARRGLIYGIWNANISVGNILGTVIPAALLGVDISSGSYCYRWGLTFFVPGSIIIIMGVIVLLFLVVDPTDVGLDPPQHHTVSEGPSSPSDKSSQPVHSFTNPLQSSPDQHESFPLSSIGHSQDNNLNDVESHSLETTTSDHNSTNSNRGQSSILPEYIVSSRLYRIVIGGKEDGAIGFVGALMIPGVIEFSVSFFFIKLVAYTFLFWLPFYIKNNPIDGECLTSEVSDYLSTVFDVGGIFGGILAGWFSDLIDARAITCVTFLYISVPVLYLYRVLGDISVLVTIFMLLVAGFFIHAPYSMISTTVASDLGTHKSLRNNQKAKATVSAIINGTGSIGAAFGPLLVGWISDTFGWDSVFYLLMGSCLLSAILLTRLLLTESYRFIKKYIYSDIDQTCFGRYFCRN